MVENSTLRSFVVLLKRLFSQWQLFMPASLDPVDVKDELKLGNECLCLFFVVFFFLFELV